MTTTVAYPNELATRRAAAGIATPERLAELAGIEPSWYAHIEAGDILPTLDELDRLREALGGIEPERLYVAGIARTIGGPKPDTPPDYAGFFTAFEDAGHLLVAREEVSWLDRNVRPDRTVDVFVNLSCGTQHSPHVLLDTVSVLEALGVSFAAGSGRLFCCGTYYRGAGEPEAAARMNDASVGRAVAWGAKRMVHMCTQCQNTYGDIERRERLLGRDRPANQQMYTFLEQTLRERGDRVPWRREVPAKVLVLGQAISPVHSEATETAARVLALVPGVQVVGLVDEEISNVAGMRNGVQILETAPLAPEEVERRRTRLAELFAERGADTMAAMHHTGQQWWSRFSSDRLAVRHPISILADALGCAHPDRYQAACRLGDPEAVLEQTRPNWRSWGLEEERARRLAQGLFAPSYASGPSHCTCGGQGRCAADLISLDALAGPARAASHV